MMYISNLELVAELTHQGLALLTGDPTGVLVDQQKVDAAILYSCNLIDVYCYNRYEIPLTPLPDLIRDLAVSLTIYNLYVFAKRDDLISSVVIYRKLDAIRILRDIASGVLHLEANQKGYKYKFNTDEKLIKEF